MEWLDVVDEDGHPTGETVERTVAHAEGIRHRTAHVWLARVKAGQVQLLLQKRSEQKDSHPGCFDISSAGHIPAGADFIPSALRELKEELGVEADASQLLFCGQRHVHVRDVFHGRPFRDEQVSRVYLLWYDKDEAAFSLQKEELSAVLWMNLEECRRAVAENTICHCIAQEELDMVAQRIAAGTADRNEGLHDFGSEQQ